MARSHPPSVRDAFLALLRYGPVPAELEGLGRLECAFCRALAEMMYPADQDGWPSYDEARVVEELAAYLGALAPGKRRMVAMLFAFAELVPVLRPPFRRFSRLEPEDRQRLVERWESSRWRLLGVCSTSLRSLLNLAYLSDAQVLARIGQARRTECRQTIGSSRMKRAADGTTDGVVQFPALAGRCVREQAEFVVVGTGPGGAVVARELAEAGRSVIALEEGPYHRPHEHEPSAVGTMRDLFAEQGLRCTRGNTPVRTFQARALGGTSLVNSAICWRAPQSVFDEWQRCHGVEGLSRTALDPYYERAEREAAVAPTPPEAWGRKGTLFRAGCDAIGVDSAPTNRAVKGCRGCSECFHGCSINAKQSMDRCYIPAAIGHGARFYTSSRVEELIYERGRVAGVRARVLAPGTHVADGEIEVRAKAVILCAGVMASPLLLLKNRLPGTSAAVGRNLSFHTGIAVGGLFGESVDPWTGGTQDWHTMAYVPEQLHMEVLWVPTALLMARMRGFGAPFRESMAQLRRSAFWCISAVGSSRGRLTAGRDWEPRLRLDLDGRDLGLLKRGMDLVVDHLFAAGAIAVRPGLAGFDPEIRTGAQVEALKRIVPAARQLVVAGNHVYGTCAMGADPARSVVDAAGAVHGVSDLYICDTSIFPAPTAVNPQLTLMAVAGRLAGILDRRY